MFNQRLMFLLSFAPQTTNLAWFTKLSYIRNHTSIYSSYPPHSFLDPILCCSSLFFRSRQQIIMDSAMDNANSAAPASRDISDIIADALKQQASQFKTIVGNLQTQILTLNVKKPSTPKEKQKASSSAPLTPLPARKSPGSSARKTSASKPPKKPSTPIRKKHPLQITLDDTPTDFKSCKEALYVHIKMMWGLYKQSDVPPTPNTVMLREFYDKFNSSDEIEAVVNNPRSTDLIARESISSLKEFRAGGGKMSRGLGHIDEMSILYISGLLAKVGIRAWAPNLDDAPDSLYNSACRITCLNAFRQLLASGTYNYMDVNLRHVDSASHMFSAYNHYVHFVMAARYKTEKNNVGAMAKESASKNIQKYRERLRDQRVEFFKQHKAKFPPRYRALCEDTLAHSDDEYDPIKKVRVIKTLGYRSKNASKFFQRLDVEMAKQAQVTKNAVKKTRRVLPMVPVPSTFTRAPTNLPIDFYDPKWFRALGPGQRRLMANAEAVCFLPNAADSLLPHCHPDEILGDARFSAKYLDALLEAYNLSDDEEDNVEDEEEEIDYGDEEIGSDGVVEDEEDEFYAEGDYGGLYDDDSDEEDEGPVASGSGSN
ncbi:uncharacterized protein MELLADRAFT_95119 [Melampsora larici-populina 98AG31]|uniref:Uncharacterized protein n=1 Tax=Melampsora larici-populina (strain 98AG31 / pathotype 3-4-7) TaxID=747676 RepID=F4RCQ7_MELLP|nr:uncharacterized protein MELLADRAFT_95119 [Melampsora larici-populina 98AG31]EGG10008.1 hypothetical protein MELLADRAFT_95119 [Melampsora larici-populina 98AG31]